MESALLNLLSTVFFVFAFGIALFIAALRNIMKAIFERLAFLPDKIEGFINDVWREWVLPVAPIISGGLAAYLIEDYPYPEPFSDSISGRVLFGLIAGFFSGSVYRFAKFHIKKYLPEKIKKKVDGIAKKLKTTPDQTEADTETPDAKE